MKFILAIFMMSSICYAEVLERKIEKLKDGRVVRITTYQEYEVLDEAQLDAAIAEKQAEKSAIVAANTASADTEELVK